MKIILAALMLSAMLTAALAFGIGGDGTEFGHMGASPQAGTGNAPLPTGKILLVDGASHLLQVDGVSKICIAGGC